MVILTNFVHKAKYISPFRTCGFIPDHIYDIEIKDREGYGGYEAYATFDYTANEDVKIMMPISSTSSYTRAFEEIKNEEDL